MSAVGAELFGRSAAAAEVGGMAAIQLLGELRHAIANNELTLVYQPKFDLPTSQIVGRRRCCAGPTRTARC